MCVEATPETAQPGRGIVGGVTPRIKIIEQYSGGSRKDARAIRQAAPPTVSRSWVIGQRCSSRGKRLRHFVMVGRPLTKIQKIRLYIGWRELCGLRSGIQDVEAGLKSGDKALVYGCSAKPSG
jgi:hypothetical protein